MQARYRTVALVSLLIVSALPALASVGEVRLYVEGLACPFCTFGIEKSLKKVPGVVALETTIRTGEVRVQLKPGVPFDPAALNEAVKKSGFTPSRIEVTVTGVLVSGDGYTVLKLADTGETFRLVEPAAEGAYEPLGAGLLEQLEGASADSSNRLTVSGRVHSRPAGSPPVLAVASFEPAP